MNGHSVKRNSLWSGQVDTRVRADNVALITKITRIMTQIEVSHIQTLSYFFAFGSFAMRRARTLASLLIRRRAGPSLHPATPPARAVSSLEQHDSDSRGPEFRRRRCWLTSSETELGESLKGGRPDRRRDATPLRHAKTPPHRHATIGTTPPGTRPLTPACHIVSLPRLCTSLWSICSSFWTCVRLSYMRYAPLRALRRSIRLYMCCSVRCSACDCTPLYVSLWPLQCSLHAVLCLSMRSLCLSLAFWLYAASRSMRLSALCASLCVLPLTGVRQ